MADDGDRLVGLGATRVEDWPYPDGADFIVLRDPDGNEFCVIDHAELSTQHNGHPPFSDVTSSLGRWTCS